MYTYNVYICIYIQINIYDIYVHYNEKKDVCKFIYYCIHIHSYIYVHTYQYMNIYIYANVHKYVGFWKFDAEWKEKVSSSPVSYGTRELDAFFKVQNIENANYIVVLGHYSALFETSKGEYVYVYLYTYVYIHA
jgi:hypothetical protein